MGSQQSNIYPTNQSINQKLKIMNSLFDSEHRRVLLLLVFIILLLCSSSCFINLSLGQVLGLQQPRLPDDEVEALNEIAKTLGKKDWDFSVDPCSGESGWNTTGASIANLNSVACNCTFVNDTICHVTKILLKSQNLSGILPPELVKLPYLHTLDLTRNYLSGTIPKEWGSMQFLQIISLSANRLSGPIPKEIGNIFSLRELVLEFNQLYGVLPLELGKLAGIQRIVLSSNNFTEPLPDLSGLSNLKDFRISDNLFSGKLPNFVEKWTNLERLEMQASGFEGPIPSGISMLKKLKHVKISDLNGVGATFPLLSNMEDMKTLILRSCNITGTLPPYLGKMPLKYLDLSFNKLTGEIPSSFATFGSSAKNTFLYLTGNMLSGRVPEWMPNKGKSIDLSYNNLTFGRSEDPSCQQRNVNLFNGFDFSLENTSTGIIPCLKRCPRKLFYEFHINCGGKEVNISNTTYDEDVGDKSGFSSSRDNWALSNTGAFMDNDNENDIYIAKNNSILSMNNSQLYMTARLSPLSLTYYGYCLLNGSYDVSLHFAEIMFSNDKTFNNLGRRVFDVHVQGQRVLQDFNIAREAGGVGKVIIKTFPANVTSNTLEIRFNWVGKGTTGIPVKGTYGPLISAISVSPNFVPPFEDVPPSKEGNKISAGVVVGIVALVLCLIFIVLAILWWKGCLRRKKEIDEGLRGLDLNTGSFTLRQIKVATNNFNAENKIGEGGFGHVYKGLLSDGTIIAVKQLSSISKQGNREFVNEIGLISVLQHPNLVKLYGFCIEEHQLLLVYEYMENNSLARALFGEGPGKPWMNLDWPTRHKICVGIARGLAYLHEESRLKVVHRDIKATNVLLDKDLHPKISDFGIAKLNEEGNTHINTRIAGTLGYMAPEYAMRGYLTDKADVYSFGIVALEIVSGKRNSNYTQNEDGGVYLLDWALVLQESGSLMELVDPRLGSDFNKEEVLCMAKVALLCASTSPTLRPLMSSVVSMLEGQTVVQAVASKTDSDDDELKLQATREYYQQKLDQSMSDSQTQSMLDDSPRTESSTSSCH